MAGEIEGSTTDLVVVGSGAAGLSGALVAALGGSRVTVLEKTDLVGGTTAISGGGAWVPCNPVMAEVGLEDTREAALTYLRECTGDAGEQDMLEAMVDAGPEMVRVLLDAGIPFQAWPAEGGAIDYRGWLPGGMRGGRTIEALGISVSELGEWSDKLRKAPELRSAENMLEYYRQSMHLVRPGSTVASRMAAPDPPEVDTYWRGTALVARLLKACVERGVVVHVDSPAVELIMEDGAVAGVRAEQSGEVVEFRAPHVLMATGGYAHSEELKRLWLNRPLVYTCENEANEGDGHRMGAAVGAQLAGLGDAWWMPHTPMLGPDGVANAAGTREDRSLPHTMMVNPAGKRFMNESVNYYDAGESFGDKTGAAPRHWPAWLIFDTQGRERYAILDWKVPPPEYRPEWVHEAATVEELATSIGVDPTTLRASVDRFNGFARTGVDDDFHRGENAWDRAWGDPDHGPNPSLGTLEQGPFYAVPMYPGAIATRGGLRIDSTGRVLSVLTGEPIPGLYASGNCSNGSAPGCYAGPGATIGPAMTFGYLVGRQVAAAVRSGGPPSGR
jgi:3-oxosteroid 1-dehydrogenase